MARCLPLLKACQGADARLDYAFNLTHEFANKWAPNFPFDADVAIRPSLEIKGTGFEYVSSGGVSSGLEEPIWPEVSGGTVTDGSITWTARAISNESLKQRISGSASWTADTGLTLDSQEEIDSPARQEVRIWVSGGLSGQTYRNFFEVTTDLGAIYEGELRITIE